jgi:2,3-bisphosphoglycerate-independent phosphoglycerate mutase
VLGWKSSLIEGDDEVLAAAALAAMAESDLVVVRTESVLDAAAARGPSGKRDALSAADARLVAPLYAAAEERDAFVVGVVTDSVIDSATHALVRRPAPFVVAGAGGGAVGVASSPAFTERAADVGGFRFGTGAELFALFA